jgi:hypothetical protein
MILHSSSAILPSSLPIKKRWGLRKFHIACCFQQLQTHWMIASHSMRLGKKNSTNLEQLDYLQDLKRCRPSCPENWILLSLLHGGINKLAAAAKSLAYFFSTWSPGRFLQLMSTDMSLMDSMIQMRSEGIFTRALWIIWSIKLGLLVQL